MIATQTPVASGGIPEASRAIERIAPDVLDDVEAWLPAALTGQETAVSHYVVAYQALGERLVSALHSERPDDVVVSGDQIEFRSRTSRAQSIPVAIINSGCLEAPSSPWVVRYGPRKGIALHLLATLREWLPGSSPLHPPEGWWRDPHRSSTPLPAVGPGFYFAALRQLGRSQPPIERIRGLFALTTTELGGLFGVSRQAVDNWQEQGVPAARYAKLATLAALADVLERQLRSERIPGIARKEAKAYGGLTMLQMISEDRHNELLTLTRASFDWAAAA